MINLITIGNQSREDAAVSSINMLADDAYRVNVANGWWRQRQATVDAVASLGMDHNPSLAIELIGLAHTELSEAVEAARKHKRSTWGDFETKDTLVRELAGTVVRIMDLARHFDLPLGVAIVEEIRANQGRGFRHGGKAA